VACFELGFIGRSALALVNTKKPAKDGNGKNIPEPEVKEPPTGNPSKPGLQIDISLPDEPPDESKKN
jgi:hypothetical protein